ncbi:hypothetical protein VMCG_08809 [Cytospora schulzeri]|uniref:Uncharacterized protein n=1 Tax=Cytospora schulzeri TaxID=448051 RepID=A0A423VS98_9PEZI|nr:hypothetical protein VMCG_08809 [Valsa malicola]
MIARYPDVEKPLYSVEAPLASIEDGKNDLRTRNASGDDWERHNVIERTGGSVHVYCELMDVQHGNLGGRAGGDDLASLMVFRFRFDSQKQSRRVLRARVKVELFPEVAGGKLPELEAIAPDERWSLMPTKDHQEATAGTELSLGSSQVVEASGKVNWSKVTSKDVSAATTVAGAKNLASNSDKGAYTRATWTFLENETRSSGVPDSVRVAMLVRRDTDEPFRAEVAVEVDTDMATKIGSYFKKVPVDDPVLFNPKAQGKLKKGRTQGVLNLGDVDLYSLCDARMSAKAFWATHATE